MKEITRIATVQITSIIKVDDDKEIQPREEAKKKLEQNLKKMFDADDVVATVQDFVRDSE